MVTGGEQQQTQQQQFWRSSVHSGLEVYGFTIGDVGRFRVSGTVDPLPHSRQGGAKPWRTLNHSGSKTGGVGSICARGGAHCKDVLCSLELQYCCLPVVDTRNLCVCRRTVPKPQTNAQMHQIHYVASPRIMAGAGGSRWP